MKQVGCVCLLSAILSPLTSAWTGTVAVSSAPPTVSTLRVDKNRLEGTGATLTQILNSLSVREPVRVPAELASRRFDVLVTADSTQNLIDAFKEAAQQVGIHLETRQELTSVWVMRPAARSGGRIPTYAGDVPRSHFSCRQCGAHQLKEVLERQLAMPVIVEAEEMVFSNVKIEWVDEASLITALREGIGLQLSREKRDLPVWIVTAHAVPVQLEMEKAFSQ